jgi:hypothetical protein
LNVEPELNKATAVTAMVCPSSAPTWNVMLLEPVRTAMPLNLVSVPMRLISAQNCATSAVMDALSDAESVPFVVLHGQLANAVEHGMDLAHGTFSGLHQGDTAS